MVIKVKTVGVELKSWNHPRPMLGIGNSKGRRTNSASCQGGLKQDEGEIRQKTPSKQIMKW